MEASFERGRKSRGGEANSSGGLCANREKNINVSFHGARVSTRRNSDTSQSLNGKDPSSRTNPDSTSSISSNSTSTSSRRYMEVVKLEKEALLMPPLESQDRATDPASPQSSIVTTRTGVESLTSEINNPKEVNNDASLKSSIEEDQTHRPSFASTNPILTKTGVSESDDDASMSSTNEPPEPAPGRKRANPYTGEEDEEPGNGNSGDDNRTIGYPNAHGSSEEGEGSIISDTKNENNIVDSAELDMSSAPESNAVVSTIGNSRRRRHPRLTYKAYASMEQSDVVISEMEASTVMDQLQEGSYSNTETLNCSVRKGKRLGFKATGIRADSLSNLDNEGQAADDGINARDISAQTMRERRGLGLGSSRSPSPYQIESSSLPPNRPVKLKTEGDGAKHYIHVGEQYQVPYTPAFFLTAPEDPNDPTARYCNTPSALGRIYYERDDSLSACRKKYLSSASLMYSPYVHAQMKHRRIRDGEPHKVVKTDQEMREFVENVARNWKTRAGWQPYSPEYAYKLLHAAQYDPYKALWLMNRPSFDFEHICDPPTRKYENKWKPNDRRGLLPLSPFPVTTTSKANMCRRQMATGYLLR